MAIDESRGTMEIALEKALDPRVHEPRDLDAASEVMQQVPLGQIPDRELRTVARAFLDAVAQLRTEGESVRIPRVVAILSAANGFVGKLGVRLAEQLKRAEME